MEARWSEKFVRLMNKKNSCFNPSRKNWSITSSPMIFNIAFSFIRLSFLTVQPSN
ncbi:hypothetical protein JZO81_07340 [Enterococcus hulanensis]|uniref:hypothetical protein n=1 Tax=Enterococcus TaxID=1350 RepID=UPI001A925447|nr:MULTISPECIES: hypothetical protein [Enterococcus]MBO0410863.1 hypothetical protein [Enterococcus hulanensis]